MRRTRGHEVGHAAVRPELCTLARQAPGGSLGTSPAARAWLGQRFHLTLAALVVIAAPASGEIPTAALSAQSRARAMAAELVRGVIDGQLRLLEENGLGDRPIHADIAALRGSIDTIAAREMQAVIDTLGRAEEAAPADRPRLLAEARQQARGIVTRLAAQRQLILRRLREASLAAQARAVLDRQRRVLAATEGLPSLPDGSREQTMLATIEEQRNVNTMFGGLTAALEDVSNWEGDVAAVGLAGLRTLREAGVAAAVGTAEQRLAAADPAEAAAAQRRAIEGLEAVIATVEGKRVARPDTARAGRDAATLGERAMAMRAEMAKVPLTDESVEKLLAEQAALQESLAALAEQVRGVAAVAPLVAEAQEAAVETSANLLEGDQRQAVANHDALIAKLEEAAARLEGEERVAKSDASAEEFAARAKELAEVVNAVQALARQQEEIGRAAPANPAAAAAAEQQLAAAVARLQETSDLPAVVEERLALAADATAAATQAIAAPPQTQPQAAVETALRAATDALAAAARETAAALADAQRAALAAKVGELSRAAEVAERAAAAERGIAEAAEQFAQPTVAGLPDDQPTDRPPHMAAAELAARQDDVAAVAAKVSDAVDVLAPEAAKMVDAARAAMAAARAELEARVASEKGLEAANENQAAGGNPRGDNRPGEPEPADRAPADTAGDPRLATDKPGGDTTAAIMPADEQAAARSPAEVQAAAAQAAQHADQAATALAQAAATMREEAKQGTNGADLARAAQMAERAAAAERNLADTARDLAAKPAAPADASAAAEIAAKAAQDLAARQAEVAAVADRIDAAVDAMQSQAAPLLDAAMAAMAEAREQLDPSAPAGNPAGENAAANQLAAGAEAAGREATERQLPGDTPATVPPPADNAPPRSAAADKAAAADAARDAEQAADALARAAATMRDEAQQATKAAAALQAAEPSSAQPDPSQESPTGAPPPDTKQASRQADALTEKAAELARAAQLAERTAAAERNLAEAMKAIADKPSAPADASAAAENADRALKDLAARQAEVAAVAAKIDAAAEGMQSQAAPLLDAAMAAMAEAREQLDPTPQTGKPAGNATAERQADQQANAEGHAADQAGATEAMAEQTASAKGGASGKEAAEAAAADKLAGEKVARDATRAAEALAQAAGAMREEAKKAAEQLAQAAAAQAAAAARARQDAEQQFAAQPPATSPPATGSSPPAATASSPPAGQPQPPAGAPLQQRERQVAALAARETALARDEAVAKAMAAALADQAAARQAIGAEAERLTEPPMSEAGALDPGQTAAALAAAKDRFAEAQRAVGEGVAAALEQQEIGSKPLREALETASRSDDLGTGFVPEQAEATADMIAGEKATAAAKRALAANQGSEAKEAGRSQSDQPSAEDSLPQASTKGQPGQGQPGQQPDASQQARGEGTGEQTGEMSPSEQQASDSEPGDSEPGEQADQGTPGETSSSRQAKNDDAQSRGSRTGEALDDSPLREVEAVDKRADAGSRSGDVESIEKSFESDAWFAKLPPEVRKAIRAGGQRRAPRGYEQKMDRYFKTVE